MSTQRKTQWKVCDTYSAMVMNRLGKCVGLGIAFAAFLPLYVLHAGPYEDAVLKSKPKVYLSLSEKDDSTAVNLISPGDGDGFSSNVTQNEPGVAAGGNSNPSILFKGVDEDAPSSLTLSMPSLEESSVSIEFIFQNKSDMSVREIVYLFAQMLKHPAHENPLSIGIWGQTVASERIETMFVAAGSEIITTNFRPQQDLVHVVLTYNAETQEIALYANGEALFQNQKVDILTGEKFSFGQRDAGLPEARYPYEGLISQIALYDRPLSADEVAAHSKAADLPKP